MAALGSRVVLSIAGRSPRSNKARTLRRQALYKAKEVELLPRGLERLRNQCDRLAPLGAAPTDVAGGEFTELVADTGVKLPVGEDHATILM